MVRALRALMWIHIVASVILGALLLIVPGGFLQSIGWAPVDPILSRVLGAALLAVAWGGYIAQHRFGSPESAIFAQIHLVFSVLAAVGVWRHLLIAHWPAMVWILGAILILSAAHWALLLLVKRG